MTMKWWHRLCDPYDNIEEMHPGDRRTVLVVYDISNNKRRYRMFKTLKSFGIRVQRSAFECQLREEQYRRMYQRILPHIDPEEDLLRVYHLSAKDEIFTLGSVGLLAPENDYWIV